MRWVILVVCSCIMLMLGVWLGKATAPKKEELARLNAALQTETTRAMLSEQQLDIEKAAQKTLQDEYTVLQTENSQLKGEMVLLESALMGGQKGLKIPVFRIEPEKDDDSYQYYLLVTQPRESNKSWQGTYVVDVTVTQDGERKVLAVTGAERMPLEVKLFARQQGSFTIPKGAMLLTVKVRLYDVAGGLVGTQIATVD